MDDKISIRNRRFGGKRRGNKSRGIVPKHNVCSKCAMPHNRIPDTRSKAAVAEFATHWEYRDGKPYRYILNKNDYAVCQCGCFIWLRGVTAMNYAQCGYGKYSESPYGTRIVRHIVDITDRDKVARHLCGNTICVNPEHLTEGTQADNMRDAARAGKSNRNHKGRVITPQALLHIYHWHDTTDMSCNDIARELENVYGIIVFGGQTIDKILRGNSHRAMYNRWKAGQLPKPELANA